MVSIVTSRVAILAPLKAWGGIERKLVTLCREFLSLGVQPELILTRGGQVPYPDQFPAEVEVVNLGNHGKARTVPKLVRHLRASKPDALLTAKDHGAVVGILASRMGRFDNPVVVKVTNTLSQTLRRPVKKAGVRLIYPLADKIIAVSNGVKDDLVRNFGMDASKISVIYNPTVTPDLVSRAAKEVFHPWLVDRAVPVIMAAGRLTPQKDFINLIESFALLRRERPCRLIILGEGGERERIEKRAQELAVDQDVCLPGYVPDPIPWIARADLFVLSSRYEGLPNVLIEALAVGAPVVSTDCPSGAAEVLAHGRYGALVPVGDSRALARAISEVLKGAPLDRELCREGLTRFESRAVAIQYLQIMGLTRSA